MLVQDYHFALLPRDDPRAAAARHHHHLLAHPVAEPGVVRHLPVARARSCEGLLGSTILGFHTQLPLQELHRDGRPLPRGAHRARALDDLVPAATRRWSSATRSRSSGRRRRPRAAGRRSPSAARESCAAPRPAGRRACWRRRRPLRLHQGHPRAAARGRAAAREAPGVDRPLHLRAGRRADAQRRSTSTASSSERIERARATRINERFGRAAATSRCILLAAAPRPRRTSTSCYRAADVCVVTSLHDGMNLVCQGVRRGARRRAGRAGAQPLRRRGARADRGADRQSLPRRGDAPTRCTAALTMPPAEQRERMASLRADWCASSTSIAGPAACCSTPGACGSASGSRPRVLRTARADDRGPPPAGAVRRAPSRRAGA